MPDPAELPIELFSAILDLALQSNTQHLYGLALLNRKWHIAMLDRIYSEWAYNGARYSFITLWKFVRTVRTNAHIAALVRTLNIGNWGFYPRAGQPQSQLQLLLDEIKLIRSAIHDAGLNDLEESIFESLSRRDRPPLIVMLLASVPNLSTLYAHVPPSDPILGTFIERTLEFQTSGKPLRSLSNLKELYLFPEVPALEASPDEGARYLKLDYLWPAFYLLSLRTLSLFDLNPHKATGYLGNCAAVSHVEDLYLMGYWGSVFTPPDTQVLLTQTKGLKSLLLCLHEDYYLSKVTNSDIWDYLQQHKGSLQTIDIYRDAAVHSDEIGYFGSFHEFPALISLGVQVEMLLAEGSPFRLQEALPSTIQALTLYGKYQYDVVPDLPEQIQELLEGKFPCLKSITLELEEVVHDDGRLMGPYQQLQEDCAGKGILLRLANGNKLPKGGSCGELWTKTFYMREDGYYRHTAVSYTPRNLRDSEELLLKSAEEAEDDDHETTDSEDEYDPSISGKARTIKVHTIPFIDHRGQTAYMVFSNLEHFPLPPLYSFAIYFTHPAATPDLEGFYEQLAWEECGGGSDFAVRFDIYFLPSATYKDCISHYSNEKATRGSYLDQVRMFKQCNRDEVHPLTEASQVVPGMVDQYYMANQVLYICSEKDWREGNQTFCELSFKELADADTTPAFIATDRPITTHSPAYYFENSKYPVAGKMYDMAHRDREFFLGPWQKATYRGWTGW